MLSPQTTHERTRCAVCRQRYVMLICRPKILLSAIRKGAEVVETLERKQKTKRKRYSHWGPFYFFQRKKL